MRRWFAVLVAIVAVVWFWRRSEDGGGVPDGEALAQVRSAPAAVGPEHPPAAGGDAASPQATGNHEPAQTAAGLALRHGGSTPPAQADAAVARADAGFVAAVAAREPTALAVGYRRLLDATGQARSALATALVEAAGSELTAQLAALGDGNAFLHCEEGRAAARQALRAASAAPPEAAVRAFTALVERAMRGAIERTDTEAIALVDEVYGSMQGALNRTVFNPEYTAGARTHQVARRETLDAIAASYRRQGLKLDALTLGLFNRISDPTKLRQGQVLKVPVQEISTVVEKRSFLMAMYVGDLIFRVYWVGHGKDDRTPETSFTVGLKQERPDWYVDGRVIQYGHPENILGDYFVKFEHASFQGYGAHGTPEPATIGTMASRGCIRMRDRDIREFFQVVPRGSPVHVRSTLNPGSR
jgi:hypothetical protein